MNKTYYFVYDHDGNILAFGEGVYDVRRMRHNQKVIEQPLKTWQEKKDTYKRELGIIDMCKAPKLEVVA